jgi:hypothetical protein
VGATLWGEALGASPVKPVPTFGRYALGELRKPVQAIKHLALHYIHMMFSNIRVRHFGYWRLLPSLSIPLSSNARLDVVLF